MRAILAVFPDLTFRVRLDDQRTFAAGVVSPERRKRRRLGAQGHDVERPAERVVTAFRVVPQGSDCSAIGALVRISVRRVYLSMSSACPDQDLFRFAWDRLRPT